MAVNLDKLLITKTEFLPYRDISINMDAKRVDPFILESQIIELRSFLGDVLYQLLEADFTVSSRTFAASRFTDLFFGVRWTLGTDTIINHGLEGALAYWSYARMVDNNSFHENRVGGRILSDGEFSEDSGTTLVRDKKVKARDTAQSYQNDAELFLENNGDIYPEWRITRVIRRKKTTGLNIMIVKHDHFIR